MSTGPSMQRMKSMNGLVAELRPIRTLREVGKLLGITRNAVWEAERQALYKVQQRMKEAVRE